MSRARSPPRRWPRFRSNRRSAPPESPHRPSSHVPRAGRAMSAFVILVVDDDRASRQATVAALEHDSCRVLAARSGGEALALIERHPGIDLAVTEIAMPGIGGST